MVTASPFLVGRVCRVLKENISLILIGIIFVFGAQVCHAATYYMGENGNDSRSREQAQERDTPWLTLNTSLGNLEPNDTLIILGGTYRGSDNVMSAYGVHPPSGSGEITDPNQGYTVIKAEVDGTVTFDGENERQMFRFNGDGPFRYLIFKGLKWINSSSHGLQAYNFDHAKFIKCGVHTDATGNTHSFSISSSTYVLAEDCYAWGGGRYKFIGYLSDHIVFRRCVGRLDAVGTTMPIATFQNYCSQYIEFQNCIAIDNDASAYWSGYSGLEGGFTMHDTHNDEDSEYATYTGCIVLNHDSNGYMHADAGVNNISYKNCIAWDTRDSGMEGSSSGANIMVDHMTLGGNGIGWGVNDWAGNSYAVTNSIIYNWSNGVTDIQSSNYNSFYNNANDYSGVSNGQYDLSIANENAIDPIVGLPVSLRNLIKIEDGTGLDGAAQNGDDIGATVMTKIGVSGTLYGEDGYNIDTGEPLWPFPNEDKIRADMRTYNPGGTNPNQPDGTRGFCADGTQLNGVDGITLTSYIWEYLGHAIPPEIYANSGLPRCIITGPTSAASHDNGDQASIALSGTASADAGITQVAWENQTTGNSGVASGTESWTVSDIALAEGDNEIVITASDGDGNTREDRITVQYAPGGSSNSGSGDGGSSSGGCFVFMIAGH